MVKAASRASEIGADALQIFSDNPTAWRRRATPPAELPAFRSRLDVLAIGPLAIHASYLINLAGPDEDLFGKSVGLLASELQTASLYGARFVNVHIGSHRGTGPAAGAARVGAGVALAFEVAGGILGETMLVLENSAGGGFGLGTSVDELAMVLDSVASAGVPEDRVGLCLDTAHLWGAGVRLDRAAELDEFLVDLGSRVGIKRVVMVHLNDSKSEPGSHSDRHQHLGAGQVGEAGIRNVLRHPLLGQATFYLETPGMDEGYDAINLARARDILVGRPLAVLSPEAFEIRGSRSRSAPDVEPL